MYGCFIYRVFVCWPAQGPPRVRRPVYDFYTDLVLAAITKDVNIVINIVTDVKY